MTNKTPKVIVVVGPTASGKSDFAVDLALENSGEIISADSRQVYKGLDIGTGKITKEEMKGVPHHMLSVYDLEDDVSVARYARDTSPILEDIISRGKTPIICGGTGQYIDALIYNTNIPAVGPDKKLREELEKLSTEELVASLTKHDGARASQIDPHNRVRIIRALEIIASLGKVPIQTEPKLLRDTKIYLLNPSREILRERITKRLEKRLAIGMIDEVKEIIEKGYKSEDMKKFGLEYVAIAKFLEGKLNEEDSTSLASSAEQRMKEEIINKSMQYAKRQQTWNRKYLPTAEII